MAALELRERGNAAFASKAWDEAARLYTLALEAAGGDDEAACACLTNRSNARASAGDLEASRSDALAALARVPRRAKALFRLSVAEFRLGRPVAAVAAVSAAAGAAATDAEFCFFARQAVRYGAWRVPPPLPAALDLDATAERVPVVDGGGVSRADFAAIARRGEPVVVRGGGAAAGLTWEALGAAPGDVAGEVIVTASGVVPDYARPRARHASRVEGAMVSRTLPLADVVARVVGGAAAAKPPLVCAYERVYAYGVAWPLEAPALAAAAARARPPFVADADVCRGGGAGGAVAWLGSAGTLTPLHYDCADGLLCQVLGGKRVWLLPPPATAAAAYLRSDRTPGADNWERQSMASLHGADARTRWPAVGAASRRRADLAPGDCLFVPSDWLHEVQATAPSLSLGWRVAVRDAATGARAERTASAKIERHAAAVRSGAASPAESFREALRDPQLLDLFAKQLRG